MADPIDQISAKAFAEARGKLDDRGRMVVQVPEGVKPGDLIIIYVNDPYVSEGDDG